jgi:indolepyruvate ferredoxin oxidoreductase
MAATITLEDKYRLDADRALITGRQALVRLLLLQRALDRAAGRNTAGFVSGYRGSPLGGFDAELWRVRAELEREDIRFVPGLNEDLALTAVAGTQQIGLLPGSIVEGVFGLWYGKGPGVDRAGDAIKHANLTGVAPLGGVVLVFGDDHAGKSSTTAHQSELTLGSWGVPILYPSSVAEIISFGLAAIALSRFSGALVGLKLVNETAEGTAVIESLSLPTFIHPDIPEPPGGVHIRAEVLAVQAQDARLLRHKLPRARAFAAANVLDRITFGNAQPRFLIATAGKSYGDVLAALRLLGIDDEGAERAGIGVYKIALIFPLDGTALTAAAQRALEIVFVEEKKAHAELQAKEIFYNRARKPHISGKTTPEGDDLLPSDATLDAAQVAGALLRRMQAMLPQFGQVFPQAASLAADLDRIAAPAPPAARRPGFCPGCPHNASTAVPANSVGATGIGCHGMVRFHSERYPLPMVHMGGEGANWIGAAAYTDTTHIFQNLGDGTYSHSGSLAIRAAIAAGVTMTYKILVNDAVAMTGGQPVEGALSVARIVRQVTAEGASRVVVLAEDPRRFVGAEALPKGTELYGRDELARIQSELKSQSGVSILIYDQVCAAEKRRRRKIKALADPPKRIFINAAVCEGCGDCSLQSNCTSIQPLDTELGRKRSIDQSACNKDYSCVKGFCPSFVIVEGGTLHRRSHVGDDVVLPEPDLPVLGQGFNLLVAGIGGTGVVTVGALLGMAARIEGYGASLYDMTGLSQKGGAVFSHVRVLRTLDEASPARLGLREADVILACDLIAAVHPEVTQSIRAEHTAIFGNTDTAATADFQVRRDLDIPQARLLETLNSLAGSKPRLLAASSLSRENFGDSIASNLIMLGFAWQCGRIPLHRESLEQAIRLNGRAAEANLAAFKLGRAQALAPAPVAVSAPDLDTFISRRIKDLELYWNRDYAEHYGSLLRQVREASRGIDVADAWPWAVARAAYKLMAYKDEYEVARLYTDSKFRQALAAEFEGTSRLSVQLAPPLLTRVDPLSGRPRKITLGPWVFPIFKGLAACRGLREGPFDLFGRTAERRLERELRDAFLDRVSAQAESLTSENLPAAIALSNAALQVRGFGPVKEGVARALLQTLKTPPATDRS